MAVIVTRKRPPVRKTPPPATLEAEIVDWTDLKWPPATLEAEIVDGTNLKWPPATLEG